MLLKRASFISISLFLLLTTCQTEDKKTFDFTEIAQPGSNGYLEHAFIYELDNRPTPECHASTIETTANGLIAAWFGGTYEKHPDVGIWVSRKNTGGNWTTPKEVANGVQSDTLRYPCWNPVLFQPTTGPLMLFYKVGPSPREWWGMLTTSMDEGLSWSTPIKLGKDTSTIGHLIGPVKNKPIELKPGVILSPSSTETEVDGVDFWKVHFEKSTDNGKSWQVIGPINDGIQFDAIQPSILQYKNGKLQVLCRSRQGKIVESWSDDLGLGWNPLDTIQLPNPNAGTDAVTLQDGRQLLVYNHTQRDSDFPASRNMLNLALSIDGDRWNPVMTLERQPGEYSYPAVIQGQDGLVHLTYTFQRKVIKYVLIDPKKMN